MVRVVVGALLVLVTAVTGSLATPIPAADAVAGPSLTITPSAPMVGEAVTVRTRLASRVARPVRLDRLSGSRWVTVERGRSSRFGTVALAHRATSTRTTLRVVAPAVRIRGRYHPRVVSRVGALRGTPQAVTVTFARDASARVHARVTVSHARSGRLVDVQLGKPDGTWTTLVSRRLGTTRTLQIDDVTTAARARGQRLRVRVAAYRGVPAIGSSVLAPPTVGVPTVLDGDPARLTVTTGGSVRAVRFYLDGVLVGEDTTAPWGLTAEPPAGPHDVVARAVGPIESALSPVATFDRAASPLGVDSGVAEGFALDTVQNGLELPTSAASTPAGAVFVTEKGGLVKVVEPADESGWSVPRVVLDLRDVVLDEGDAGMTGLAVDPDFAVNGHVYLSYVLDDGGGDRHAQQVVRFTWLDGVLQPDSRHVVLGSVTGPGCFDDENVRTPDCVPMVGQAHTIGDLGFDSDGRLLVGIGDGSLYLTGNGLAGRLLTLRAQDPEVLAGKVLRIDPVTGHGVPDNPLYVGDGTSNASRVLALGLRNPFRFTVRGDQVVIGDVGEMSWEEVDVLDVAESAEVTNFGWPCIEGDEATDLGDVADPGSAWHACAAVRAEGGANGPSYSYAHHGSGGSISGGVFLDSLAYPAAMRGRYVFGDYAQAFIRTADVDHHGAVTQVAGLADATAAEGPVKFFTGPDGLVWSVSITTGALRRIRWTGEALADRCPVGSFRRTFHDLDGPDSLFDQEYQGDPAYSWTWPYAAVQVPVTPMAEATCESAVHLPETSGSRFATSWRGRIDVEAGTWRFEVDGTEWMRVWVDNQPVHDFYVNPFWGDARTHDVVLSAGQHLVQVEHLHGDQAVAAADLTWTRVGGPPSVSLVAPVNGYVPVDGGVPWSVEVSDPDGDDPDQLASSVVLAVDMLHHTGETFHAHPSSRITGETSGIVEVDDVHAPGSVVVRLRATVTDASGAKTTSAPAYVCLPGTMAGPCAEPPAASDPVRIMLLGDSVTQGKSGDRTWRNRLWRRYREAGVDVDFVGPRKDLWDVGTDSPGSTAYADPAFDRDHAARWGMRIGALDTPVADLVAAHDPDVVVVMLGVNDLLDGRLPAAVAADTAALVEDLQAASPAVAIVLSEATQHWFPGVVDFNAALPAVASAATTASSPVVVAHAAQGYDVDEDTWDQSHPNASGEVKIAAAVAEALRVLGIGSPA
ncbi:MAG: PQQ-dependent sugar dehydrogenase [Propionibacteriales bacterium]|nr:PQQ-dependent sugar dehydrogenase [Propionibacteriales bacterium]